jgi:pimeloyl-ACP methyl ester carboxylesterase
MSANDENAPSADRSPRILPRPDGATIAYRDLPGRSPTVVFLHGFKSDMTGAKALAVERFCHRRGQAFVRFDGFGHGESSGAFADGTIGRWTEDTVAILDEVVRGPAVLVGSSMGGWLMLLAALRRRDRVAGLLGLAAAPDFTEELLWHAVDEVQRGALLTDGHIIVPSDYDSEGYVITRTLIEDGRQHLLLEDTINLQCPVRLIQGLRDADVPWRTALRLQERLAGDDVEVVLVKDGDHRLSRDADLARLETVLEQLLRRVEA